MLQSICEELADSLPRHGIVGGKTVVLKLKYDTFDLLTRSTTVGDIVSEKERMLNIVKKSLKELVKNGEKVMLMVSADCFDTRFPGAAPWCQSEKPQVF